MSAGGGGIKGLSRVLADRCPNAIRNPAGIEVYRGRVIAIDANQCLYQFLNKVRHDGSQQQLANSEGEITSHISGMFYRTIKLVEQGIRPIFVFEGAAPSMKYEERERRSSLLLSAGANVDGNGNGEEEKICRRKGPPSAVDDADSDSDEDENNEGAFETQRGPEQQPLGTTPLLKPTDEQIEDCKRLLRLMGVPVVDAPGEAKAQCGELVRAGKAYATASEGLNALAFGSAIVIRNLAESSETTKKGSDGGREQKKKIQEYALAKILKAMNMTREQFVDLCILLGCAYCPSIRGVGPKTALKLISQYGTIEAILANIDRTKFQIPEKWKFDNARALFLHPAVTPGASFSFKWAKPDSEAIVAFICGENGFNPDRINSGLTRMLKACEGTAQQQQQGRIDSSSNPRCHWGGLHRPPHRLLILVLR